MKNITSRSWWALLATLAITAAWATSSGFNPRTGRWDIYSAGRKIEAQPRVSSAGVLLVDTSATALSGGVVIAGTPTIRDSRGDLTADLMDAIDVAARRGETLTLSVRRISGSGSPTVDFSTILREDR